MRIGLLEAEVAAKQRPTWTVLVEPILLCRRLTQGETHDSKLDGCCAFAFAFTTFAPVFVPVSGDKAQAQPAADRKTQRGSGQCRLSNGQKC